MATATLEVSAIEQARQAHTVAQRKASALRSTVGILETQIDEHTRDLRRGTLPNAAVVNGLAGQLSDVKRDAQGGSRTANRQC